MSQTVPWFEDFHVGDDFSDVPALTVTDGHGAIHQALFGDRLRLPLDQVLAGQVTGQQRALVNPSLVCNLAIGQSTIPSQRVMGNLFYRGLTLHQPVFVGDTLTTTTKVVGLRQNKQKEGRPASGMVALEIHVTNQDGGTVMLFWRCPMIPCLDPQAQTGHSDDFSHMPETIAPESLLSLVPDWHYSAFRERVRGKHFADLTVGEQWTVAARDTITLAPELVRMTLNMAMTHTDAGRSVYGQRLVYGGHTIAMAAAQITRVLPTMMTILGWFKCDHLAPVFEQDIIESRVTIEGLLPGVDAQGGVALLHVEAFACRQASVKVLDWHLAALFA
ncbi:MAG: 2-methylfumaryl-CoA hydratase [Candidatus Pseudothioglobus sp.]|jgi:acyl dehydratase